MQNRGLTAENIGLLAPDEVSILCREEAKCVVCWEGDTQDKTLCCQQRLCGTCYDKVTVCPTCRAKEAFKEQQSQPPVVVDDDDEEEGDDELITNVIGITVQTLGRSAIRQDYLEQEIVERRRQITSMREDMFYVQHRIEYLQFLIEQQQRTQEQPPRTQQPRQQARVQCQCGAVVARGSLARHRQSARHQERMATL